MSPALYGSSAIRHFECSDAIKTYDRIIFDFYTGLPHMYWFIPSHVDSPQEGDGRDGHKNIPHGVHNRETQYGPEGRRRKRHSSMYVGMSSQ